jgi:hypothetical protein
MATQVVESITPPDISLVVKEATGILNTQLTGYAGGKPKQEEYYKNLWAELASKNDPLHTEIITMGLLFVEVCDADSKKAVESIPNTFRSGYMGDADHTLLQLLDYILYLRIKNNYEQMNYGMVASAASKFEAELASLESRHLYTHPSLSKLAGFKEAISTFNIKEVTMEEVIQYILTGELALSDNELGLNSAVNSVCSKLREVDGEEPIYESNWAHAIAVEHPRFATILLQLQDSLRFAHNFSRLYPNVVSNSDLNTINDRTVRQLLQLIVLARLITTQRASKAIGNAKEQERLREFVNKEDFFEIAELERELGLVSETGLSISELKTLSLEDLITQILDRKVRLTPNYFLN